MKELACAVAEAEWKLMAVLEVSRTSAQEREDEGHEQRREGADAHRGGDLRLAVALEAVGDDALVGRAERGLGRVRVGDLEARRGQARDGLGADGVVDVALAEAHGVHEEVRVLGRGEVELGIARRETCRDEELLDPLGAVVVLDGHAHHALVGGEAVVVLGDAADLGRAADGEGAAAPVGDGYLGALVLDLGDADVNEGGHGERGRVGGVDRLAVHLGPVAEDLARVGAVGLDGVDALLRAVELAGEDVGHAAPGAHLLGHLRGGARRVDERLAEQVGVVEALLALGVHGLGDVGGGGALVDDARGAEALALAVQVGLDEVGDVEAVLAAGAMLVDVGDADGLDEDSRGGVDDGHRELVLTGSIVVVDVDAVRGEHARLLGGHRGLARELDVEGVLHDVAGVEREAVVGAEGEGAVGVGEDELLDDAALAHVNLGAKLGDAVHLEVGRARGLPVGLAGAAEEADVGAAGNGGGMLGIPLALAAGVVLLGGAHIQVDVAVAAAGVAEDPLVLHVVEVAAERVAPAGALLAAARVNVVLEAEVDGELGVVVGQAAAVRGLVRVGHVAVRLVGDLGGAALRGGGRVEDVLHDAAALADGQAG
mmetsp:Transcript_13798/g.39165  ORF Transcript_13798/g.39165 Transcript_13798/m.39165 type:complete len:600 (-) Transcript_13798:788-2587(-)